MDSGWIDVKTEVFSDIREPLIRLACRGKSDDHTADLTQTRMFVMQDDSTTDPRLEARQFFHEAYEAQLAQDYELAKELYKRSIETYPTAEAHTFLGWVYSFEKRYEEAIAECLEAIRVDETLGNPYNDIGSYLLAQGDTYGSVRWFKRALLAPRYESYAFPHFNLGRVYESRKQLLQAARHYGLALQEKPDFTEAVVSLRRIQSKVN